jgi:ribosome biogenesis protein YTM1
VTSYEKYRVTDAPIAVPSKLGRYGLSEIINHLLDFEESAHQPFDFSVNNRLLRTSLKKFVTANRISTEEIIEIDYTPAVSLSEESDSVEVPSWIGSLDCNTDDLIIAGCYDGQVKIISADSLTITGYVAAHEEPIRSIRSWRSGTTNLIATTSKDQAVKCFSLKKDSKKGKSVDSYAIDQVALLAGHVNSVESIDIWSSQQILLTGDWSGNIFGWNVSSLGNSNSSGNGNGHADSEHGTSRKKQKSDKGAVVSGSVRDLKASFTIRAHAQSVSGLQVSGESDAASKLYSCSWDHSLKEWDIGRQDCVATFASSKVMTSLHYSQVAALVATSHPDGRVRLWDPRKRDEAMCVGTYGSSGDAHWIAQVRILDSDCLVINECEV